MQLFTVDSSRIEFAAGRGGGFGARGAAPAPAAAALRRCHGVPLQGRSLDRRQRVRHRFGQDEERRHAVHGIRRDSAHALPFRSSDHHGLAAPPRHPAGDHGIYGLRKSRAGPEYQSEEGTTMRNESVFLFGVLRPWRGRGLCAASGQNAPACRLSARSSATTWCSNAASRTPSGAGRSPATPCGWRSASAFRDGTPEPMAAGRCRFEPPRAGGPYT